MKKIWEEMFLQKYSSPRCGKNGYWNDFIPFLDYGTRQEYADSIAFYVKSGQLKEVSELYYPVRLKPKGENSLEQLKKTGSTILNFGCWI